MSTDNDRQRAGHSKHHEHDRLAGAESPRELLAVYDPSKRSNRPQPADGGARAWGDGPVGTPDRAGRANRWQDGGGSGGRARRGASPGP